MNFKRFGSVILSFLVLFSFVFFVPTISSQGTDGAESHVYYARYTIEFHYSSTPFSSTETMRITNSTFNGMVNREFTVQEQSTTYVLSSGNLKEYKGTVELTLGTNGTVYVSSPAPLVEVEVTSGSQQEIAWAGVPSTEVQGYAYVNGSGEVSLVFLNGTGTTSESFNVSAGKEETYTIDVYLNVPSFQVKETNTREVNVNVQGFERYNKGDFIYENSNVELEANNTPFSVSTSYFDGKDVPSMVWSAPAITFSGMVGYNASFMMAEFFGINGTEAGFVRSTYVSNAVNFGGNLGNFMNMENLVEHSSVLIVSFNGAHVAQGRPFTLEVNGMPVVVQYDQGNVSTTVYVNMTHQVYEGTLVEVFLNGVHYVFVNSSNASTVQLVKPTVKHVVINVNSTQRSAIEADISSTGYAVFNISIMNSSFVIYKNVGGHLVLLNSRDYFIADGNVTVFSDPAQQYYLVYTSNSSSSGTQSNSSTSSTSSTSTSSSSTSTSSSTMNTQSNSSTSPSQSSSYPSSSQSVSTSQSNYTVYIIAVVVVIIVAIGIAYLLRR